MENLKAIKKLNLFKNLEENEITALLRCFSLKILNFKAKKKIVSRQDRIENIYIIISGSARETWFSEDGDITTSIDYREGDIIGLDYASGARKTFSNDIFVLEDLMVVALDSFRFFNPCNNFCPRHTKVINNAFGYLAKQHSKLLNRVKELTMPTTKAKIMCYLANVRAYVKSNSFDIPYNRQELADYLGVERSALSKELSELQKKGIITFHKNHFEIKKTQQ